MGNNDAVKIDKTVRWLAIYTLVIGIVFAGFAIWAYYQKWDAIIKLLIYAACSGGIGGVVFNAYSLIGHRTKNDFDPRHRNRYIYRPAFNVFLTIITFFIFFGLLMLTGIDPSGAFIVKGSTVIGTTNMQIPGQSHPLIVNKAMLCCSIAFLAGYFFPYYLQYLTRYIRRYITFGKS